MSHIASLMTKYSSLQNLLTNSMVKEHQYRRNIGPVNLQIFQCLRNQYRWNLTMCQHMWSCKVFHIGHIVILILSMLFKRSRNVFVLCLNHIAFKLLDFLGGSCTSVHVLSKVDAITINGSMEIMFLVILFRDVKRFRSFK